MSVEYIKRLAGPYIGDGTGQNTFSFGFLIFEESDVYVAVATSSDSEPSDLQQGTDYTVSMNADQSATPGGTITLTSGTGLAKDAVLVIGSAVDYTQTLDLTNYTRFAPELITTALDRIVVMIQQIVALLGRVVQVPPTSSISPSDLFYQLLNAAKSAAQSAEDAAASLAACEQIRQLIEQYSWDIPHIVESLRDVENYPYDGVFWVGGFGKVPPGQDISNRYVKANGSTTQRALGERFADIVNVKDFGAVGDGQHDDTEAIQAAIEAAAIGAVVLFPFGKYSFSNVSVQKSLTLQGSGAVLIPQKSKFDISRISKKAIVAKYKNMFYVSDVSFFKLSGFTVIGDYDPAWGYVNVYQEEEEDVSAEGNNLFVVINSSNVFIDDVRFNKNIITIYKHEDFYERCTSKIGHSPLLVSNCDKVTIRGIYHVDNMCEEIEIFNCKEVKILNSRCVSNYGHSMLTLDYCDGVDIFGCEFSILDLSNVNSVLNIHSKNVNVYACLFNNGGNLDIGREDVYFHLIPGHNTGLDQFADFVVENVEISDCSFFNLGILSQFLVSGTDTEFVNFKYLDNLNVHGCQFVFDLDRLTDYQSSETAVSKYVWWLNTHHGKFGTVSFTNNSIVVKGTLKSDKELNDYRLFIVPGVYEHKSLLIRDNELISEYSNQPSDINTASGDGWLSVGASIEELVVENNKIDFPVGVTVRSATLDSNNKPSFSRLIFNGNHIKSLWGIRLVDYSDILSLSVNRNIFSIYDWTGGLFQHEKSVGVNCLCFIKAVNATVDNCMILNNECESACIFKVADSTDGIDVSNVSFVINTCMASFNSQRFKAISQTATNTARGLVIKNVGASNGGCCQFVGNQIELNSTSERNRIYNFNNVIARDNIFDKGGLFTECAAQGEKQAINGNFLTNGALLNLSSNYITSSVQLASEID